MTTIPTHRRSVQTTFWRMGLAMLALCGLSALSAAQTPLGTAFTYQGLLTQSGSPASGAFDLRFILYNAENGGSQVGATLLRDNVMVAQGRFTVELDFGSGIFAGDRRWLEIYVRPGASTGSYTTLRPRQLLYPAPYALHATSVQSVPWNKLTSVPTGLADGDNDTTYTAGVGLTLSRQAFSVNFAGNGSAATAARSDHSHANNYTKTEVDNRFVHVQGPDKMIANDTSPTLTVTQAGAGPAGKFVGGQSFGVSAFSKADISGNAAVYGHLGEPSGITTNRGVGVWGEAEDGFGVYGLSNSNAGVYGFSTGSNGVCAQSMKNHGIVGMSSAGVGFYGGEFAGWGGVKGAGGIGPGGYFSSTRGPALVADGPTSLTKTLEVGSTITALELRYRKPRVHYWTVTGEGFHPGSNVDYVNTYGMAGAYLYSGSGAMTAAVHLPDGARLTAFKAFFYVNSTSSINLSLERTPLSSGSYQPIVDATSSGLSGYANRSVAVIPNAQSWQIVDNTTCGYLLYAYSDAWDGGNLRVLGAQITYEIDEAE